MNAWIIPTVAMVAMGKVVFAALAVFVTPVVLDVVYKVYSDLLVSFWSRTPLSKVLERGSSQRAETFQVSQQHDTWCCRFSRLV